MKREYETPVVENLSFDYTDVVAASGNYVISESITQCTITDNGHTFLQGRECKKDKGRLKNKPCL